MYMYITLTLFLSDLDLSFLSVGVADLSVVVDVAVAVVFPSAVLDCRHTYNSHARRHSSQDRHTTLHKEHHGR